MVPPGSRHSVQKTERNQPGSLIDPDLPVVSDWFRAWGSVRQLRQPNVPPAHAPGATLGETKISTRKLIVPKYLD
jgi:hypothetical protein